MLAVHEYVSKAKEVARVRARITFMKAMTLLNMSTGLELLHGRFSLRNGLSSSSLPSRGANSYEPREAISLCGQVEERHKRLPLSFLGVACVRRGDAEGAQAGSGKGVGSGLRGHMH